MNEEGLLLLSKKNRRQPSTQPPIDLQAQLQRGLAFHQQGRLADAEGVYGEILQRAPNHFDALHLLGVIAYQNRGYERAVQFISKAISINPNVASAYYNRGVSLKELMRLEEALVSYEKAIALKPDFAEAYSDRGNALKELNRLEEALASYDKAIALKPDFSEAYYNRGNTLKELKRLEDALVSYDKAIALKPDFSEAYSNRSNALQELKRLEEALVSYNRTIALKPDSEDYYNRGITLKELKRLEEALVSYEKAIALNPDYAQAYSNRAIALKELKRLEEALISCDKAIALKPDFAEAYYNRGVVLKELRRLEEALVSYEKAITLKQDYAEAYSNRGNVLQELKRLEEALVSCDKAIALRPDFAEAYSNRGNALKELDRREEALVSYDKAIALKPDYAEAYSNRGIALQELERLKDALISHEKAVALKPDLASAYNAMGSALKELGQLEEARAAFVKAIDIDPMIVGAYFNLADSKKFAPGDPNLAAMQKLVAMPKGLSKNDRMELDFALGKTYADLADHRRSFQHLLAANASKRATISYNEKAALALSDRIETAFTGDLIAAKSGGGNPSQRPIFILGMPRSGTTLVEQILASHPLVHGGGELETLGEVALGLRGPDGATIPYPEFVPALDQSAAMAIGTRYLASVDQRLPKGERVTDKMPSNYHFAGLIHLALPNAKIIHTVRNPVDTCISCFTKLFARGQSFTYDLGELGRYYKRYARLMEHWRRVLPPGRILDVRYEDVIEDVEMQARGVISYCGLPWDDRCLSFHETDRPVRTASAWQVRQPIYKSAVGRWHDYEEFLRPLLTALGVIPSAKTDC
jgi:tetratricopeptide (TPR) repeat protein